MTLPFDEAGVGPPVVLLHAGVADRTMWAEHLQPLADAGHRALAVDLPGFGEATPALVEDAPWLDVLETMDELGIPRATLVGNSFGGAVAQRVAVLAPERVLSLALISSPAESVEPSPELKAVWEAEEAALGRGDVEAAVPIVVDAWTLPDAPQELQERVAAMERRTLGLQAQAGEAPEAAEVPEAGDPIAADPAALAGVDAPALVVVGEHDRRDFQLAAEALARELSNARLVVLAGAGHLAPLERPREFRELLLSFLAG
jgi:pimeloyl-ACP methyl ester carboxylesterase